MGCAKNDSPILFDAYFCYSAQLHIDVIPEVIHHKTSKTILLSISNSSELFKFLYRIFKFSSALHPIESPTWLCFDENRTLLLLICMELISPCTFPNQHLPNLLLTSCLLKWTLLPSLLQFFKVSRLFCLFLLVLAEKKSRARAPCATSRLIFFRSMNFSCEVEYPRELESTE